MRKTKRKFVKKILYWLATLCCAVVIFTLSSQPAPVSDSVSKAVVEKSSEVASQIAPSVSETAGGQKIFTNRFFRDCAHVIVFSLFAFFLTFALRQYKLRYIYLISSVICVLYGVIDEVYQNFFATGRSFQFEDMVKDWCGSLTVILLVAAFSYMAGAVNKKKLSRRSV